MGRVRRFFRLLQLGMHLLWGAFLVLVAYPFCSSSRRLSLKRRWSRRLLAILAIRLEAAGSEIVPGSLIVANHISWVDILAINALVPVAFVAKSEVRDWPLIGWLAANTDTVFLRRGSRGHAKIVNREIDTLLNAGKLVAIFPEGTTTDGSSLLGFHAALLQAAIETHCPVQPLAISYESARGGRSLTPAYVGDTRLLNSLDAILAEPGIVARLKLLPAQSVVGSDRRQLAHAVRAEIALSLGLPLANNRPEIPVGLPDVLQSNAAPTGSLNPVPANSAGVSAPVPTSGR